MPLNLDPRSNPDYIGYLKFNAKSGRWYTRNGDGLEVEVKNPTCVYDLATIKTGWLKFEEGIPPNGIWDENGSIPPKPSEKHKRGFAVDVLSSKNIYGLKELSSNSNGMICAITRLYNEWEKTPEAKQGKLPVVQCASIQPIKSKFGVSYEPDLRIINQVDRPAAFPNPEPAKTTTKAPAPFDLDELDDDIPDFGDPEPNPKKDESEW
jgi:hypothetical protein